jgi:hypothetical protein
MLETFRFTMSLPADIDLLPLLRDLAAHMARYVGLPEDQAQGARELLERAVADRLRQPGAGARPVRVTFERPYNASTTTVEVTWDAPPGETPDEAHARSRFSWQVHDAG